MFRVEMLPAAHGDALWIEWGTGSSVHRLLIDGGPGHTYPHLRERILHLPQSERKFELLVVTHVDADHIEGIVRLLQDAEALGARFERIWFNGKPALAKVPDPASSDTLGALQGEYLSVLIEDYEKLTDTQVLNEGFPDGFVARVPGGEPPRIRLAGELYLTVLSPDPKRLLTLADRWEGELKKAKLESGDEEALRTKLEQTKALRGIGDVLGDDDAEWETDRFEFPAADGHDQEIGAGDELGGGEMEFGCDASPANGSSIALLAEFDDTSCLFAGDAYAGVLAEGIDALRGAGSTKPLRLDLFKLPHHGSMANMTEDLLSKIDCKNFMISTSGAKFRHPHAQTIDLLVENGGRRKPQIHFNYRTETTAPWDDEEKMKSEGFVSFYPTGMSLQL